MLSQRLAKNYFLSAAGHGGKRVQDQLASDSAEFKQSIGLLAKLRFPLRRFATSCS